MQSKLFENDTDKKLPTNGWQLFHLFGCNGHCGRLCRVCSGIAVYCHNAIAVSNTLICANMGQLQIGRTVAAQLIAVCIVDVHDVLFCSGNLTPADNGLALVIQLYRCGRPCQIAGTVLHGRVCRVCITVAVDRLDLIVILITGSDAGVGQAGAGGGLQQLVGLAAVGRTVDLILDGAFDGNPAQLQLTGGCHYGDL